MNKRFTFKALLVSTALAPGMLWAQAGMGMSPSAEQLKGAQEAARTVPGVAAPSAPSSVLPRELGKPEDDMQVDVRLYQVDGLPGVSPEALAALTAPFTGKARSYEDLVNAVAAVTRYMQRDLGYYVGFAYLPEQVPQDGVVHIAVLEGRLDQIQLKWTEGLPVSREVVEAHLAQLKSGDVLRVGDVERMVFLLNDLQGLRSRFEIEAGREPGTASLVVTPQAEARVTGRLELDSLGSRYTGIGRLGGQVTLASPTGRGDVVSLNALSSLTGGLAYGGVTYVSPVGASGLKLGAALSKVVYQLDKDQFTADLDGDAVAAGAFGLYPLVRSRNLNLFTQLSYEHKRFDDRMDGASERKSSKDWQLGLLGDFRDSLLTGGLNTYEINWLQGRIRYDGTAQTGVGTEFGKLGLGYSRLQNVVSGRVQLYARYKAQLAYANLDYTERFTVGGPSGVRAFAPGEGSGDTGHALTAELRFLPPESWFGAVSRELAFSTFYDWGHVKFCHDAVNQPLGEANNAILSGYGVGATWDRAGDFVLRVNVAWRAAGRVHADSLSHAPRANAVLSKSF